MFTKAVDLEMLEEANDITTVSRLLGHKSLTMTLRYSHLSPKHMVEALNILDNTLNDKPTLSLTEKNKMNSELQVQSLSF